MRYIGGMVRLICIALICGLSPLTVAVRPLTSYPSTVQHPEISVASDSTGQSLGGSNAKLASTSLDIQDTVLGWHETPFQFAGINGFVVATAWYDEKLILAGAFDIAHNLRANNIIAWDGHSWSTLGSGIDHDVTCLTVFNNRLIAGGGFSHAGGVPVNNIAAWDGTSWQPLQNGIPTGKLRHLESLMIQDSLLVVGGVFDTAGTVAARNIACWNGSEWRPLGSGTSGRISALVSYQNRIIAGGQFAEAGGVQVHSVASWDGTTWQPLGESINQVLPDVQDFAVYQDKLIAVGSFTVNEDESKRGVAAWDGMAWASLGLGTNSVVRSAATYHNRLYISGWFSVVGGIEAPGLAVWDGAAWSRVGSSDDNFRGPGYIYDLFPYGETMTVAGHFDGIGTVVTSDVARWNDTVWTGIGTDTALSDIHVRALTKRHGGSLVAAGLFARAGGTPANGVAVRDQAQYWHGLGTGFDGSVRAMIEYDSNLIAGGDFARAGDSSTFHIAVWKDSAWTSFEAHTDSLLGPVAAITIYGGQLVVGGGFQAAGSGSARHIASWNGDRWRQVGDGIDGPARALTVFRSNLLVGGDFSSAAGYPTGPLASWDGSRWSAMSSDHPNGIVCALLPTDSLLYVAGEFDSVGSLEAKGIAAWNGANWSALGEGVDGQVTALALYTLWNSDRIVAGGTFTFAGNSLANNIASWDGLHWESLGSGTDGPVEALAQVYIDLYAGGNFQTAGGIVSPGIAVWAGQQVTDVSDDRPPIPGLTLLQPNYPNPFNPSTTIEYSLPRASQVTLTIYNVLGQQVKVLVNRREGAGNHIVTWDGTDAADHPQSSGVYFYRLTAGDFVQSRKMLLLK